MFRATQKIKTWLFACLMAVVTALVAVSACLLPTSTVANAAEESATWTLVTDASTLAAGDEIIIAAKDSAVAMSTTQNKNNRGQASITKKSGNTLDTPGSSVQQLTLEAGTKDGTFAFNTGSGYLYAASSDSNYLRMETTLSANSSWTISITSAGVATVKAQGSNTRNWMRYNNSSKIFAAYASEQKDIVLYKLIIDNADCDHANTELIKNNDGTHKVVCANETCKKIINAEEKCVYSTLGSWETVEGAGQHKRTNTCACGYTQTETAECSPVGEGVVTPPTATEQGYTTYVCKDCGGSYQDDYTATLTEYTVNYVVPAGVEEIASEKVFGGNTVELPTLENPIGYTFVGWTEKAYNTAVEEVSEVLTGDYKVKANVDLYALYSQTVKGDDAWTLVKNTSALAVGDKIVIAATGYEVALSTTQNKNNRGKATITKSGENITFDSDVQMITLANGNINDTWAFNVGNGYLYAAGGSSENYLRTTTTLNDDASFTVEIADDGNATVKAPSVTKNWLRYNNGNKIFSCYGSGQTDICLYKFVSGTKTVYQTLKKLAAIDSATLTVKDDLTVNYYVNLNDYYVGARMKFTMLGEETVVDGVLQADGIYKYSFTDIAPQYMGENIKAELVFNGKVLTTLEKYSVQQYVKNTINSENQTLKRLLSDLLYYGDAAQKFVGYNEENLVSAGVDGLLDQVTANPTTVKDLITEPADSYPIYFKSAGMLFDNVNKLYVRLEGSLEGATLSVAKDGVKVNDYALTSNVFYTDGIVATDFNAVYTFELYVNNTKLQTLTYSVNSYAHAMQGDAEMGELAAALYNYGAAAEDYKA